MAALGSQTIASSFEQLLHVDTDGGGDTSTLVPVKDGDNGTTFCISMTDASTGKAVLAVDGSHANGTEVQIDNSATDGDAFLSFQLSGTSVFTMGVDDGDSDKFKIGTTAIGTGTMVTLDSDSVISLSTGDAGTSNTLIGKNTGDAIASGGNYNVLIGEEAGGALTTGDNNVVIGYTALDAADLTESDNVAIGHAAMSAVDEGSHGSALADGNIAIGTNALLGGSFGSSDLDLLGNVAIGYQALDATAATAQTGNVAIGYQAATALNHADASGTIAIGYQAGLAITQGQFNTVVGYQSLKAQATGDKSTAIGYQALKSCTGVSGEVGNTAIGYKACEDLTTGQANVAIGINACGTTTTGGNNICIGRDTMGDVDAGSSSKAGGSNIFIGDQAGSGTWLDANSSENVAIGKGAMPAALNGASENVCIGQEVANALLQGDANTLIGKRAGYGVTDGSNNTCVGKNAGGTLTTGVDNICIGNNLDVSTGAADTQCVIGNDYQGDANGAIHVGDAGVHIRCDWENDATWDRDSDERIKNITGDSPLGLDFLNAIPVKTFTWKARSEHPETFKSYDEEVTEPVNTNVNTGVIAQTVKAALDSAGVDYWAGWSEMSDGCQQVGESAFVFPLIKAIQELSAKVTALENA